MAITDAIVLGDVFATMTQTALAVARLESAILLVATGDLAPAIVDSWSGTFVTENLYIQCDEIA